MVSSLFSSGTSYIKLVADPSNELPAITYWLMGSLSGARLKDVSAAVIPMLIGIVPLLLLRWRINILTLGDEEAATLGVNTNRLRMILLPTSMIMGAGFLLLVDNLSRNLLSTEIPIGILTAFIGAPFFIYLMTRRRNHL